MRAALLEGPNQDLFIANDVEISDPDPRLDRIVSPE